MTSARKGAKPAPSVTELGLPDRAPEPSVSAGAAAHARARVDRQVRALLGHHDGTRAGTDPEELHQFRVAVRRLRSLLKGNGLFDGVEPLREELRWLGDVTGPVRDLDVLLMRLADDIAGFGGDDARAADELLSALRAERTRHRRVLGRSLSSRRYREVLEDLAALATSVSTTEQAARADLEDLSGTKLLGSLHKPWRKLDKAARRLAEAGDPPDDDVHALRIRVKRLRYAAETAVPSAKKADRKQLKAVIKACKELQDVLGEHQDAVVAADRIRKLSSAQSDPRLAFVAGRLVERECERRAAARAAWPAVWQRITDATTPLL